MYRVYLLTNREGLHYIGLSQDVENRLRQHNALVDRAGKMPALLWLRKV